MSQFDRELATDMFNSGVFFANILHIGSLRASNSDLISDAFQEFLGDMSDLSQGESLKSQCKAMSSTIDEIRKNPEISRYSFDVVSDIEKESGDFEFLIQVQCNVPYDVRLDQNGDFQSCSIGGYITQWILAKDMYDAGKSAIEIWDKLLADEVQKAQSNRAAIS